MTVKKVDDLTQATDWLMTRQGLRCSAGVVSDEYLRSRLITAFLAGMEQARKVNTLSLETDSESLSEGT